MFLIILYHKYLWIFLIYSLYIPHILPKYVPCIFPCVFLNLWSQEKISPYRKTTEIFFLEILRLLYAYITYGRRPLPPAPLVTGHSEDL